MAEGLRELVAAAVAARDPVDAREAASIEEVLTGLRELDQPFDQAADPVHVTGSGLVVGERGIVLLRHKRLGIWVQPGGHLDQGETPWQAAARECREETGLPVEHPDGGPVLLHVDAHAGGRGHRHLDLRYLLHAPAADPDPGPQESQQCRWFDWAEAIRIADDGLRGAIPLTRRTALSESHQTHRVRR